MDNQPVAAALRPDDHRISRACELCGAFDDLPHHLHIDGQGVEHARHIVCCAAAGCWPDDVQSGHTCMAVLAERQAAVAVLTADIEDAAPAPEVAPEPTVPATSEGGV